jgi:hypothetical protein
MAGSCSLFHSILDFGEGCAGFQDSSIVLGEMRCRRKRIYQPRHRAGQRADRKGKAEAH